MLKKEGSDPFTSSAASGSPAVNLTAGQRIVLDSANPTTNYISSAGMTVRPTAGYVFTFGAAGDVHVKLDATTSYSQFNPIVNNTIHCGYFRVATDLSNNTFRFGRGRNSAGALGNDTFTSTSGYIPHLLQLASVTPASGSLAFTGMEFNPTLNGVSSGIATMVAVAPVVTAWTGGTVNLLDMGTTTTDYSTGYTSKFKVDTNGKVTLPTAAGAPTVGTATLVGGTVTVSTTAVTASSKIFVTCNTPGGTQGFLSVPTASIVAATSFVINSSNGADTSTVNWWFVN